MMNKGYPTLWLPQLLHNSHQVSFVDFEIALGSNFACTSGFPVVRSSTFLSLNIFLSSLSATILNSLREN